MKALYLPNLPRNPERQLEQLDSMTVMGAKVFGWSSFCALLKHGTYDAYFVPGLTARNKQELVAGGLTVDNMRRLVGVSAGSKIPIKDCDELVLTTLDPHLRMLATLRRKIQRYDAPVCGLIHSVNSERMVFAILQQYFAGLCEADLLLCSSTAGMRTIEVYIQEVGRLLPTSTTYRPRRVLVPLGVTIPPFEPSHRIGLRQRLNVGAEENIALFFGRLSQMSKSDLGPLLVAWSRLAHRELRSHLVIAGDDTQVSEAPRLTALAHELDCMKSVTIWPNPSATDKHMLYSGADIFVSPSDNIQETFGLTVAEALSYGLPAVVSDWDGYRDIVRNGETGFLVPTLFPSNIENLELSDCTITMVEEDFLAQSTTIDVSALSDKIQRLLHDPALRRQMGRAARRSAEENYSWPMIVKRYEELWEESIQMAKAVPWDGTRTSPLSRMSLEKCYGHFATEKRHSDCKCFMTAEGREWLKQPSRFYFLCHWYGSPSPQKFNRMLRAIAERPGARVADLIEATDSAQDRTSTVDEHWALGRLFKYGLVTSTQECAVSTEYRGALQTRTHAFRSTKTDPTTSVEGSGVNV